VVPLFIKYPSQVTIQDATSLCPSRGIQHQSQRGATGAVSLVNFSIWASIKEKLSYKIDRVHHHVFFCMPQYGGQKVGQNIEQLFSSLIDMNLIAVYYAPIILDGRPLIEPGN
jgi:hypothetical protein